MKRGYKLTSIRISHGRWHGNELLMVFDCVNSFNCVDSMVRHGLLLVGVGGPGRDDRGPCKDGMGFSKHQERQRREWKKYAVYSQMENFDEKRGEVLQRFIISELLSTTNHYYFIIFVFHWYSMTPSSKCSSCNTSQLRPRA